MSERDDPGDGGAPGPPAATRRPDASMTLIRTMMERPLDPGYAAAAERREAAGLPRSTSLRSPVLVVATLAMGLVVGVSASNLTAADSPRSAARKDLVQQIEDRRTQVDDLATRARDLQAQVTALEASQLDGPSGDAARSRELAEVVGALPMQGPGVVVTLDDPDDADDSGNGDPSDEERVISSDIQFVVNALWASGAEAVSINGNRLTSVSAIRFAGSAIIVDFRPLTRPYVITAIGDPQSMPTAFADGAGGSYLATLHGSFGLRADTDVSRDLSVPAAVGLTTRYADTVDTEGAPTSGAVRDRDDEEGRP
ncbi:DUF881 domain-containing protein [Phycicoccus sp. CSK15P-2]|uniref:DUF881 domain-containing protein n=1 Tax=Phycicoccus sp. CSK15P-2 TaxID=2807627 RepID=UPI00194FA6FE|nr:DUF881 domain-containing protein [Phycicoccus sp. CSK15P-2]MBM6405754.1 DUF881 domain-containing protein [Phycicoccus sp. CSK15P-2]